MRLSRMQQGSGRRGEQNHLRKSEVSGWAFRKVRCLLYGDDNEKRVVA